MKSPRFLGFALCSAFVAAGFVSSAHAANANANVAPPHPAKNPGSRVMLTGAWVPADPATIDFERLPRVPVEHVVICDVSAKKGVNQHNYLIHHDGRFWAMWSDGPRVEDMVGQVVKYSTSVDGLKWDEPKLLTGYPPGSGPDSPHYNTRKKEGLRYISRGLWVREGQLLALVSLDEAAGFFGESLELRAFRWNSGEEKWVDGGIVQKNAINNFPPQRLPTGEWAMTRRKHDYKETGVEFLIGGVKALDNWTSVPVVRGAGGDIALKAEEPIWWTLPDGNLMALFRDNGGSKSLFRAFSTDSGRSWSTPVQTDFPDARSKLHGLRLSDGRYALVSNSNPKKRDPLTLALSRDGMTFDRLFYVVGGRHVDYPHMIEHGGYLYIAHSGAKMSVEIERVRIADLDRLSMPAGR
ncbi:exo-alpha-sialidase [Horticoccus sp. 23ND18S-11]|uniref:exo-alpha-sialidase n=1 Tax=Horticoccus sp. 23ND18S-11 TaxID=3391832 RepID=UPI0039C93C28